MSYTHPEDSNLKNLHKSMEYNGFGQPVLRVNATFGNNNGFNSSTTVDAFGRMRTSEPLTLFDCHFRYRDNTQKWNQVVTGTGDIQYLSNESSMLLTTSGTGTVIRETKQVFSYQPGKSLLIMSTFAMNSPTAGVTQRVGYYGDNDGVRFEAVGTVLRFVIRSSTSGNALDTEAVNQSNWNVDKLDGTGPSGITLDVTKTQIFWCDIEWLGVGSVRCGFVVNGVFQVCHVFHHANLSNVVYTKTACLPLRYELITVGTAASMRQICSTVMSEGGYVPQSVTRSVSTSLTSPRAISNTALTPLISLRLKSGNLDAVVIPNSFSVYGLSQAAYRWALVLNPTLNAGTTTFTSAGTDSSVEYNIVATGFTGGTILAEGIFVGDVKGGVVHINLDNFKSNFQLGRSIDGVSDIFCLAALATTVNDQAVASMNWQEHT